ncbi:MAG: hypothetical protein WD577_14605 [Bacteroidales bacterium]
MENKLCHGDYLNGFLKKVNQTKFLSNKLVLIIGLGLIAGANACTESEVTQGWDGITVDVKADNAIETSQKITAEEGGLQRLDVTISNQGAEIVTLENIEIRIPITEPIANDMDIAYGGRLQRLLGKTY